MSKFVPAPVKESLRRATPHWAYLAMRRAAAGDRLFQRRPTQLFLSNARVRQLEARLWGGFAGVAVPELENLVAGRSPRQQAAEAALVLSRYYAADGLYERALHHVTFARVASPPLGRHKRARLIEIYSLLGAKRTQDARLAAELALREVDPDDSCLNAALASVFLAEADGVSIPSRAAAEAYLGRMNRPLKNAGFVGVAMRDSGRALALDNLGPETAPPEPESMPVKVSVLMAVYNGVDNLEYAVRSVLQQTWRNLELVIVDDASTDESWQLIERLAAEDTRITAIRQTVNGGAYVARNAALARATGEFVVVNDADDWAHPQKIETQARALLKAPATANLTFRVRVSPGMVAQPRLDNPYVPIIHEDYSSLMLPRETVLGCGGWDNVRASADAELIGRLQAIAGDGSVGLIHAGVPLSFSLLAEHNLVMSMDSGMRTFYFGSREAYTRQYREWHRSGANLKATRTSQVLPFPVPGNCYYGKNHQQAVDVILVSDFLNAASLRGLCDMALEVAIVHWPCYESGEEFNASPRVARLCRERGIVTLTHGEPIHCKLLLIETPVTMMQQLDRVPNITAERAVVLQGDADEKYEPEVVQRTIVHAFGKPAEWIAGSDAAGVASSMFSSGEPI